jgi:hypothetical protein
MSEVAEGKMVGKRRSRVEAEKIVLEFEASGLTRQVFCSQRGLSVAALDKYRRRRHVGLPSGPGRMVPVEVYSCMPEPSSFDAEVGGALLIELRNGRRIEVRRGFDAVTLERLLTVLDKA